MATFDAVASSVTGNAVEAVDAGILTFIPIVTVCAVKLALNEALFNVPTTPVLSVGLVFPTKV
jgi:hypothetical protein